jgi:hypothetical protein
MMSASFEEVAKTPRKPSWRSTWPVVQADAHQFVAQMPAQDHMGPGQHGNPDNVDILGNRLLGDFTRRFVQTAIDHFMSGLVQGAGNHFGADIVTVEAWFGDQDFQLWRTHR